MSRIRQHENYAPGAAHQRNSGPCRMHAQSLSSKCRFATLLDPHGGRPASAGLGALSCHRCRTAAGPGSGSRRAAASPGQAPPSRRGVLMEDMGQTDLAEPDTDGEKARTLRPLQVVSINNDSGRAIRPAEHDPVFYGNAFVVVVGTLTGGHGEVQTEVAASGGEFIRSDSSVATGLGRRVGISGAFAAHLRASRCGPPAYHLPAAPRPACGQPTEARCFPD